MKALTENDFERAAFALTCGPSAVKAVCAVEAPRGGFNPDGSVRTLFEGHKFSTFTKHRYDKSHPEISYPTWTKKFYGSTWQKEQARLLQAQSLDRDAALMSASWGKFQIMGFNFHACGFSSVEEMVEAMGVSEGRQLDAFVNLILDDEWQLDDEMQAFPEEWACRAFARRYNGKGYEANNYHVKLAVEWTAAEKARK